MDYQEYLKTKSESKQFGGIGAYSRHPELKPFQSDIIKWALGKGRAAIFADCGLGKTFMQLDWAAHVVAETKGRVLILAPLAVAMQTVREAKRFGYDAGYSRDGTFTHSITVTNYEHLEKFDVSQVDGVVLDESSILKHFDGKFRTLIIDTFKDTKFKLACTATPSPNDHMELGNHAEFLGVMSRAEMLSMFFVHDGGETSKWRLKGHARKPFWEFISSWAVCLRSPADIGHDSTGYDLPALNITEHIVGGTAPLNGYLFPMVASTMQERRQARSGSVDTRADEVAALVASKPEAQWLIWCNLNSEADAIRKSIPGAVEVRGSDSPELKESRLMGFIDGSVRVLVTKPSIAGFGLNLQCCADVVFCGLSDSYEEFYQAIRRCWRFGQEKPVTAHVVISDLEGAVLSNIKRKESQAEEMMNEMTKEMRTVSELVVKATSRVTDKYKKDVVIRPNFMAGLCDCVDGMAGLDDDSIHYSVFSPPFASLYTYSASDRDMGNCSSDDDFYKHFGFLIEELYRTLKPGRLLSFHCMNLPRSKSMHGVIGIRDFRGELIRLFESKGFIFHSEVVIWKDPVTAMQRTKALGLLHKQLKKDACMSRQGIPDFLVTMRKPGTNAEPVTNTNDSFPVGLWQNYASPVWMDINPSDTLQFRSAREHEDERHICPLQLEVIRRAIRLWSNPGDVVLSPFAGIGSEGFVALEMGRKFIGFELKESYWKQMCKNLDSPQQAMVFELTPPEVPNDASI